MLHTRTHCIFALVTFCTCVEVGMTEWSGRHIRSPLMRTVYNRILEDQRHRDDDHTYWYHVDLSKLPEELCDKFVQLQQDAETSQFLDGCYEKSDWIFTQLSHTFLRYVLSWFMTSTSVNGWLDRGSMFIFSHQHLQELLGVPSSEKAENLLDLGAGDGMVTAQMAKYCRNIFTTEMSPVMVQRLMEKGYHVLDVEGWSNGSYVYDIIGCLNLLDRCDKPISMLYSIKQSLRPGSGRVVIAVVLPYKPYVEIGAADHNPTEYLHVQGTTFEEQVVSLTRDVFMPAGFTVEKFTKLPYLCEGDLRKSFFVLYDAVFVLRVTDT